MVYFVNNQIISQTFVRSFLRVSDGSVTEKLVLFIVRETNYLVAIDLLHDFVLPCINQQPPQRGGAVPSPVWVESKWLVDFRGSQLPRALPFIFSLCCPLNGRRKATHSFLNIVRLFSLSFLLPFFCPSSSPHFSSSPDER